MSMAEFKPNKKQQEFLDVNSCNVLVSASAGSGKTSTMIQKLLKIIAEEHVSITSLLVVTYTNAAASEIKLRLFNEFTNLINQTDNIKEKTFLLDQLDNINNAEIGTLHAICKKLIVKYFYKLEESPDFNLLSDKEEKYLLDNSIKNVFNKHITSNDESFFQLYDCYNSKRNDNQLKAMCLSLYNYKCSKVDYNQWRNDFLNSSYNENLNINSASTYILEYYQKSFLRFSSQIRSIKEYASSLGLEKYDNFLNQRLQFIDEINRVGDFETAVKVLSNLKLSSKPVRSKNANAIEIDLDEEIDKFHKFFGDYIKKFKEDITSCDIDEIINSILRSRDNVVKLMDIVDEIENAYNQIKRSKNSLDFNDLEHKMLTLLSDGEVQNSLKQKYKYIFVDEYQDINDKQENILKSLVSGNNYYMIGDVKQSIYAFRQSSPKIFISKYNQFSADGISNKLINFNANYRSDRNILEFANTVFDSVITKDTIGIDYAYDARFVSDKQFENCNVAINIINNNNELDDKENAEALIIAKEISRLINEKRPDGKNYQYGDIAIILRQRGTFVRTLSNMLMNMQIPVSTTVNSDFFNTSEIQLLISILKLVSNYRNDIAIAVVLKNLFNMSEDELMNIRAYDEKLSFHECVRSFSLEGEILDKINQMFEFVRVSRKRLLTSTIRDYLEGVINHFQLILSFRSNKDGKEKESNILEFLRISDNDNYKYNLDKFLEYLDFISKEKSLQHVGTESNAVQILTIHHSKGLEYPAVILGGMGKSFQLNKDSGNIIINNEFGVGLKSINNDDRTLSETIVRNACKLSNKRSEIDEEIRLLYVAMTRAKEKLSMVGTYDLSLMDINRQKGVYSSKNYFDLIFKSINSVYLSHFINKKEFVINENQSDCANIRVYSSEDFDEETKSETPPIILDTKNHELVQKINNVFNNRPNTNTVTIKNTVTNILKEESHYENLNYAPKRLDETDDVPSRNALKIGTAYHSIMQELKFTENKEDVESLVDKLISEKKIDSELKKYINIDYIIVAIDNLKDLILNAHKVYKEKQFLLCENYNKLLKSTDNNTKVIVQGVIDLVVMNDDGAYLIDYKTNRGVSASQLIDEYRVQLELYAYAFEMATNIKIKKKYLYSFTLGLLIEVI